MIYNPCVVYSSLAEIHLWVRSLGVQSSGRSPITEKILPLKHPQLKLWLTIAEY
ncbi:hypothetical protein [Fortiea contorta]|uniref:hypothetical protein n=1 Tax=Fortiea contorta TaxID=1892405 RepID=UPI0012B61175|nr:hypothetical protein [Fortiea contorta]